MLDNSTTSIKELIESGAHFGHQASRWNPKMKPYIYDRREGIHIIDLAKTKRQLSKGIEMLAKMVRLHQQIIFVGTKKQAKSIVKEQGERCSEFYINERWLGGTLTNLPTIRRSIRKLEHYEEQLQNALAMTKKEQARLAKKMTKLRKNFSGIRGIRKPPGLMIVVDSSYERIAVHEANILQIPVMALIDTNGNPDLIDYPIPINDDSQKTIALVLRTLADVIISNKEEMESTANLEKEMTTNEEPT